MTDEIKEFCRKLGITGSGSIKTETPKEAIYKECKLKNLTDEETKLVYNYYRMNYEEFMINPKMSYTFGFIVDTIVSRLNITNP